MDDMVHKYKTSLKSLVTVIQIKNKCIQLQFSEEKMSEWASQLVSKDKGFEWNTTVPTDQARVNRV